MGLRYGKIDGEASTFYDASPEAEAARASAASMDTWFCVRCGATVWFNRNVSQAHEDAIGLHLEYCRYHPYPQAHIGMIQGE